MIWLIIFFGVIVAVLTVLKRRHEAEENGGRYPVNYEAVDKLFKFKSEVDIILNKVHQFCIDHSKEISTYPFLVNPYAFALAVRQQESGRPGREFGVLHPDAVDTDLDTQAEWFLSTLLKDTIRWHKNNLWNNWKKDSFPDFISYFAKKYAPVGASNDPNNLNRFWENNVRYFYNEFKPKPDKE